MLIYIAGPLKAKKECDIIENVTRAVKVGGMVFELGHECIIPHLFWYSHRLIGWPVNDDQALAYCFRLVNRCDALIRLPGESEGADKEVATLTKKNRPVVGLPEINKFEVKKCLEVLKEEVEQFKNGHRNNY